MSAREAFCCVREASNTVGKSSPGGSGGTSESCLRSHGQNQNGWGRDFLLSCGMCRVTELLKPQARVLGLGNAWLRGDGNHVGWSWWWCGGGKFSISVWFLCAPSMGCPTASVKGLFGVFFSPSCQQGVGKTPPPSWVQVVRRISGPGFDFLGGSRGCLRLLAAALAGRGGLPRRCLLARLFFLALIFSPPSPNRLTDERSPAASPCSAVPGAFRACKSRSERFPEVPPGRGTFLLRPPWVALGASLGCGFGPLVLKSLCLGQKGSLQTSSYNSAAF